MTREVNNPSQVSSPRDPLRWLYSLFVYCCLPVLCAMLYWRYRDAKDYNARWRERFGFVNKGPGRVVWLHLASVGEVLAARELLETLLKKYPQKNIVVTTTTPTGAERVAELFGERLDHYYLPFDTPGSVSRFLTLLQPELLMIMETELWPNIIAGCQQKNIPVVLINGRMSERSAQGYQRFGLLSKPLFQRLDHVVAQSAEDQSRFYRLGAKQVSVTGNIKYDFDISAAILEQAQGLKQEWTQNYQRQVLIAASTHRGEEELILAVFQDLKYYVDDLLLVLVPRHRERFDQVARLCLETGYQVQHRSYGEPVSVTTDILLGDTMGELMLLYGASDIAFVGGSLIDNGGHNMLEPAAWGLPVLTGPSVYNFTEIAAGLSQAEGLTQTDSAEKLAYALLELLQDGKKIQHQGTAARLYFEGNKGALSRLLERLHPYFSARD